MGNYSIRGTKYRHLPSGSECIVLADFPDRHRVRIQLDNGQERDEVAYHDMADVAPVVKTPPAGDVTTASEPPIVEAAGQAEEPEGDAVPGGLTTPRRFSRRLRGEE